MTILNTRQHHKPPGLSGADLLLFRVIRVIRGLISQGHLRFIFLLCLWSLHLYSAEGPKGAVVSVHPLASAAGLEVLQNGGNAIDAIVATALTLGVVDGHNSGIGGGCFLLLRLADGTLKAIDGRETAPAGIRAAHYLTNGQADLRRSQFGSLAAGVPGAVAAYAYAATNHGRWPWKRHFIAAARIAEEGFPLPDSYAWILRGNLSDLSLVPSSKTIFTRPDGAPWRAGDNFKQGDLAKTYRALAEEGPGWFYGGPFATATERWMQNNGGLMRAEDFKNYSVKLRPPVRTTYRGYEIVGFPPPSSGGVHVAQILNILENFDLRGMGEGSVASIHLIAEAFKLAFADRAYWLGDPDFVKVPMGLISKNYGRQLAGLISLKTAKSGIDHGQPPDSEGFFPAAHTTHFCAVDREGNWAACTATLNTSFGSKVVIPGTGVLLNNQMDDFSLSPGVPNFFGLVGSEANAVAPGKRPLSSMSPTLVFKEARPVFSIGAAGGPTIISQVVLGLVRFIDFGAGVQDALARPRFHHQWKPDLLQLEKTAGSELEKSLGQLGHRVKLVERLGAAQAIGWREENQVFVAEPDPRGGGQGLAW